MAIYNHSVTADEYVINAHLVVKINTAYTWEEGDIERLLNHVKLDKKREYLRELNASENKKEYLEKLKVKLEEELENE